MSRWLSVAIVLMACSSERVDAPPSVPANWSSLDHPPPVASAALTAKERTSPETYIAALASPQFAGLTPLFDDLGHATFGRTDARGRDNIIALHEQLFGALDQRKTAVTRVWRTDETAVVEWTLSGVHAREWLGVAPTQKPVALRGVALLWTNDNGTLSEAHLYFSVAAAKAQLGVGPMDLQGRAASLQQSSVQSPPVDQERSPAEQRAKQVVRDELDALEQGKEPQYLDAFASDIALDTLTMPRVQGKADLKTAYVAIRRAISELDTAITNIWGIGSFVIVEYTISGELHSPFGTVRAAPDRTVRIHTVDVVQMRDLKIAHVWRYDGADLGQ